jgi:hypothetical protein
LSKHRELSENLSKDGKKMKPILKMIDFLALFILICIDVWDISIYASSGTLFGRQGSNEGLTLTFQGSWPEYSHAEP